MGRRLSAKLAEFHEPGSVSPYSSIRDIRDE